MPHPQATIERPAKRKEILAAAREVFTREGYMGATWCGEIALLTGARRAATVIALTPLRGWTLARVCFDVPRWDPGAAAIAVLRRLLALTNARLRATCTELAAPLAHRPDSRVSSLGTFGQQVARPAVDYLASLLCFAGFRPGADVEAIVRDVPAYAVERGDILIQESAQLTSLLLVVRGAVEVMVRQPHAARRVRVAGPGRFVGHSGIRDDGPIPVIARCRERSVVFAFPGALVEALLGDSDPPSRAFSAAVLEDSARGPTGRPARALYYRPPLRSSARAEAHDTSSCRAPLSMTT